MAFNRKKEHLLSSTKTPRDSKINKPKNTSKKRSRKRYHFLDVDHCIKNFQNDKHKAKEKLKMVFDIEETAADSWFKKYIIDKKRMKEVYIQPLKSKISNLESQVVSIDKDLQKFYGISLADLDEKRQEEKSKEPKIPDEELF